MRRLEIRKRRGSLILEEILLIAVSIAVLIALISIVSGILGHMTKGIEMLNIDIGKTFQDFTSKLWHVITSAFKI
ncbi:MAG: hypothetical protein GXO26_03105 [Crenarchaeota archaeon]|jgi:hypothetical protein|nr:hypothetical protein [Thermoproteota archaeon]